jgi:hypothetical protein
VSTDAAIEITNTSETLTGKVNPGGEALTECRFEYGLDGAEAGHYEHVVSCSQEPAEVTGTEAVSVSATISGLQRSATYHFRLSATNANGTRTGADETFTLFPTVSIGVPSQVGSTEATVEAEINPGGVPTGYRVQYVTDAQFKESGFAKPTETPAPPATEVTLPASTTTLSVQQKLTGLAPGTAYHFRFLATNSLGQTPGGEDTFRTLTSTGPTAFTLPDGRVDELVSVPGSSAGDVYVPFSGHQLSSSHENYSAQPVRAAPDGNAIAYVAEPPPGEGGNGLVGEGQGNVFIAARAADGWRPNSIEPPVVSETAGLFQGFSSSLSLSVLSDGPPTTGAPALCETTFENALYVYGSGNRAYTPLFTFAHPPGECGLKPQFAGVSADDSSVTFETNAALTPGATAGQAGYTTETRNIYDSVGGKLYPVNVLPNGMQDVNAALGGVSQPGEEGEDNEAQRRRPGYHHYGQAIARDGSRVVWTDLNTAVTPEDPSGESRLFVRENPSGPTPSTVQVDASVGGGGNYQGASSDGSKVFFTKGGALYEYNFNTVTTNDLAPAGDVLGISGVSEDGAYVYFVAKRVLSGNENSQRDTAHLGEPNLYVRHAGQTTFIATLFPTDNELEENGENNGESYFGDWRTGFKTRTAEVTPNGLALVFTSRRGITGYDNNGGCHLVSANEPAGCPEIFVYNADSAQLVCGSCNPSGQPPVAARLAGGLENAYKVGGGFLPAPSTAATGTYQLRWISEDGSRVFFDTAEPLVPRDTNGVQDVYEWERAGTGSCHTTPGCVYIISSPSSSEEAYFVDASASGNDVFLAQRSQLGPEAHGEEVELYDARVGGGFPQVSTECTGTGCQGVPPAPPMFATPSSVTFHGTGNFSQPAPLKVLVKPSTRAQKLARALKACHTKHDKRKRAACKARARKRYGPHKAKKPSKATRLSNSRAVKP